MSSRDRSSSTELPDLLSDPNHDPLRGVDLQALQVAAQGALSLIHEQRARLDDAIAAHAYSLQATVDQRLTFVCASEDFRVELVVVSPSGRRWRIEGSRRRGESEAWRAMRMPESGTYVLIVTSRDALGGSLPASGTYRLRVFAPSVSAGPPRHASLVQDELLEAARYGASRAVRTFADKPKRAPELTRRSGADR